MEEAKLDSKGRIVIPERVRRKVGFRGGSKLKVRVEHESVVITKSVTPKEFIEEMEGFLKEDSPVQASDPLKLKEIWLEH
ncbi:MAG: AbrB/MazE/SpoVT family DNA-binding domain-containing protein [Nitrososphaerales archaeon]